MIIAKLEPEFMPMAKVLNDYKAADEVSKDIAKRLINLEEKLAIDIRDFL